MRVRYEQYDDDGASFHSAAHFIAGGHTIIRMMRAMPRRHISHDTVDRENMLAPPRAALRDYRASMRIWRAISSRAGRPIASRAIESHGPEAINGMHDIDSSLRCTFIDEIKILLPRDMTLCI